MDASRGQSIPRASTRARTRRRRPRARPAPTPRFVHRKPASVETDDSSRRPRGVSGARRGRSSKSLDAFEPRARRHGDQDDRAPTAGDRHARVRVRRERDGELQLVQARVEPHQGTGGEGQQRCARIADPPKPTNPPRRSTPKPEQLSCQPFEPQRRPRRSRASDPATFPTRRSRRAQRCGIPRRAGSSPRSCEISPWRRPWARAVSPS